MVIGRGWVGDGFGVGNVFWGWEGEHELSVSVHCYWQMMEVTL